MNAYLTYVNNIFDEDPKRLTLNLLNQLIDSPQTLANLQNYRETGNEGAKKLLPAVMFNGLFSHELADAHMATPLKPGEKPHTRRDNPCFVAWPFFGIDIDADDANTLTSGEQWEMIKKSIESEFKQTERDLIVMAYATPSRGSLRIVAKRSKGLSIAQEQERWNAILPIKCDARCKNLSRLYFLTSREDLLYENFSLLFSDEPYDPADYPTEAVQLQDDYTVFAPPSTTTPCQFSEETLEDIATELEHCVGGGSARPRDRNTQVFRIACLMRHLVGHDVGLLQRVIPRYGLDPSEHFTAICNALKTTPTANIPQDLERAIARATSKDTTEVKSMPPQLPEVLPPALAHLASSVPEKTRAAAIISSFAAWRIHLHEVQFHYIDNLCYEPSFMCICIAEQTEGKKATRVPSECIMESIKAADRINREKEQKWREACATLGANKDKPQAPALPIRDVQADMTNPALVKLAVNAGGYSLYTYAEELEKLKHLHGLSEIIRTAYDGECYGQERVTAGAVSQVADRLRWSFNVSTTPQTARMTFKNDLNNGTLTRISFSTIQSDPYDFGDIMPVYGDFGTAYKEGLKPYIDNLAQASGTVMCTEAEAWAERERQRQIDKLRGNDMRYMVPFMKRSLQMGFWRAMMLYIMNGNQWDATIEDFASWSIDYDLWCKLYIFGDLIEASKDTTPDNSRLTTSLITLLPQTFTLEQARNMRRDVGRSITLKSVRNMLNQWVFRGYVRFDETQNIYVKTNSKKHAA
jgi:hypothetical protein